MKLIGMLAQHLQSLGRLPRKQSLFANGLTQIRQ